MRSALRRAVGLAVLAGFCGAALAHGHEQWPEPGQEKPRERKGPGQSQEGKTDAPPAENLLGGPTVSEGEGKAKTLVKRSYAGEIERLETSAEEAAVELVALTEEERAAAQRVFSERAAAMDEVIANNIPLLLRLDLLRTGTASERADVIREVREALAPVQKKGRLLAQVEAVLPAEKAKEVRRLVEEYWRAVVDEGVAEARKSGEKAGRTAVLARESLKALGQEVRRSYERIIAEKTGELDRVIEAIGPTSEQETKLRNLVSDFFQQTLGKPTAQQRAEFFQKFVKELTPEQRRRVYQEMFVAGKGAGAASKGK